MCSGSWSTARAAENCTVSTPTTTPTTRPKNRSSEPSWPQPNRKRFAKSPRSRTGRQSSWSLGQKHPSVEREGARVRTGCLAQRLQRIREIGSLQPAQPAKRISAVQHTIVLEQQSRPRANHDPRRLQSRDQIAETTQRTFSFRRQRLDRRTRRRDTRQAQLIAPQNRARLGNRGRTGK